MINDHMSVSMWSSTRGDEDPSTRPLFLVHNSRRRPSGIHQLYRIGVSCDSSRLIYVGLCVCVFCNQAQQSTCVDGDCPHQRRNARLN